MLDNLKKYNIILGSKSPRRKELLSSIGLNFKVITHDIDEVYPDILKGKEIVEYLSELKTKPYSLKENELLITSDTIVVQDELVLGKPKNKLEAFDMLSKLSGKEHSVISGVCIKTETIKKIFSVETTVVFTQLTDKEIYYYIDKYEPFDKAGGYGIQEWIGFVGVEKIIGSYYNVVGLPLQEVFQELKNL